MNFTLNWLQQEFIGEHMPMMVNRNNLEKGLLILTYISYLGFFSINNDIKFMFYIFEHLKKK